MRCGGVSRPRDKRSWRKPVFAADQSIQALERKSKVSTALVVGHCVNLVHDDRLHAMKMLAAAFGGEKDVEGFRCRDQNVRRVAQHRRAFLLQRVTGAYARADFHRKITAFERQLLNFSKRLFEILLNVIGKRLQR